MSNFEKTRDLLLRIKALAEQGHGGEAENAKAILEQRLRENGLTLADLEDRQIVTTTATVANQFERRLFHQIAGWLEMKSGKIVRGNRKTRTVWAEGTAEQGADLLSAFAHYRQLWIEEQDLFFAAFIRANDLYGPENRTTVSMDDLTPDEYNQLVRRNELSQMVKTRAFRRQIED